MTSRKKSSRKKSFRKKSFRKKSFRKKSFRKKSFRKINKHLGGAKVFSTSLLPRKTKYRAEREIYNDIIEHINHINPEISTYSDSPKLKFDGADRTHTYTIHELGICLMERGGDAKSLTYLNRAAGVAKRGALGMVGMVADTAQAAARPLLDGAVVVPTAVVGTLTALYAAVATGWTAATFIPQAVYAVWLESEAEAAGIDLRDTKRYKEFMKDYWQPYGVFQDAWWRLYNMKAYKLPIWTLPRTIAGYSRLFSSYDPETSKLLEYMTGDMNKQSPAGSASDDSRINGIHRRDLKMFIGKEVGGVGTGAMFSPYFYMALKNEANDIIILAIKCSEIRGIAYHNPKNLFFNEKDAIKNLLLNSPQNNLNQDNIFSIAGFFNERLKEKTHVLKFNKDDITIKGRSRNHDPGPSNSHTPLLSIDGFLNTQLKEKTDALTFNEDNITIKGRSGNSRPPLFFITSSIYTPSDSRKTSFHMRGESIISSSLVKTDEQPFGDLGSVYTTVTLEDIKRNHDKELTEITKSFNKIYTNADANNDDMLGMLAALMSIESAAWGTKDELAQALKRAQSTMLKHTTAIEVGNKLVKKVEILQNDQKLVDDVNESRRPAMPEAMPITLEWVRTLEITKMLFEKEIYDEHDNVKRDFNIKKLKEALAKAGSVMGTIDRDGHIEIIGDEEFRDDITHALSLGDNAVGNKQWRSDNNSDSKLVTGKKREKQSSALAYDVALAARKADERTATDNADAAEADAVRMAAAAAATDNADAAEAEAAEDEANRAAAEEEEARTAAAEAAEEAKRAVRVAEATEAGKEAARVVKREEVQAAQLREMKRPDEVGGGSRKHKKYKRKTIKYKNRGSLKYKNRGFKKNKKTKKRRR